MAPHSKASAETKRVKDAIARHLDAFCANPRWATANQLRGLGAIRRFEHEIARLTGKKFCVAVNSATNGLLTVALAAGLVDSEIVTTPKSFGATWGPFLLLRNRLRYAQVEANGNLDPNSVRRRIRPTTKAVLAVDYLGIPHDTRAVRRICDDHNIFYIADAAQSFGRYIDDQTHASALADALVLSFGPGKPLCCGEGGAILTSDAKLYESCVRVAHHPERFRYEFSLQGYENRPAINARIHPLAAVMGLAQLGRFDRLRRSRSAHAKTSKSRQRSFALSGVGSPGCSA